MKTRTIVAGLVLFAACAAMVVADDKPDHKKLFSEYMEKFGPPGPEHKFMEPLVGTWAAKCKVYMDPNEAPQASDGLLVRKLILGGRFLEEKYDGKMNDKPFQGCGIMGYDRAKKKWIAGWIDSASTGMHGSQGTYDEASKTWTFKKDETCPITGKPVKMRDTLKIVNDNEEHMDMFRQLGDEKEFKFMEIHLTRKQ
jgi:hypothetical protein